MYRNSIPKTCKTSEVRSLPTNPQSANSRPLNTFIRTDTFTTVQTLKTSACQMSETRGKPFAEAGNHLCRQHLHPEQVSSRVFRPASASRLAGKRRATQKGPLPRNAQGCSCSRQRTLLSAGGDVCESRAGGPKRLPAVIITDLKQQN